MLDHVVETLLDDPEGRVFDGRGQAAIIEPLGESDPAALNVP